MKIKAIKEIKEGSLMNIQANHFLDPVIFATNIKAIAGRANIAAIIDNFSIVYILIVITNIILFA